MAVKTIIAWTDHTFNLAWGCAKIDPGCKNCYADTLANRYGFSVWGEDGARRIFGSKHWAGPENWNSINLPGVRGAGFSRLVFCSSMCDWAEDHPTLASQREKLWPLIKSTPHLDWQLLTKRADKIESFLPADWSLENYPNVWLGVSISEPKGLWRADCLRSIPAAVRFVSYEPALADLSMLNLSGLDWIIYGGESGPGFRAHDLAWPRAMRNKCKSDGVAFFFKQSAAPRTETGITLDGEIIRQFPTARQPLIYARSP